MLRLRRDHRNTSRVCAPLPAAAPATGRPRPCWLASGLPWMFSTRGIGAVTDRRSTAYRLDLSKRFRMKKDATVGVDLRRPGWHISARDVEDGACASMGQKRRVGMAGCCPGPRDAGPWVMCDKCVKTRVPRPLARQLRQNLVRPVIGRCPRGRRRRERLL